jgi:hypothetical protein
MLLIRRIAHHIKSLSRGVMASMQLDLGGNSPSTGEADSGEAEPEVGFDRIVASYHRSSTPYHSVVLCHCSSPPYQIQ